MKKNLKARKIEQGFHCVCVCVDTNTSLFHVPLCQTHTQKREEDGSRISENTQLSTLQISFIGIFSL
jgi:hypothetical protein